MFRLYGGNIVEALPAGRQGRGANTKRIHAKIKMISKKEVEHIAHLARIKLTEEEIEKFQKELSLILDYMEKLKKVDTKDIMPLTGATFLHNSVRMDEAVHDGKTAGKLLSEVPEKQEGYTRVKAVF